MAEATPAKTARPARTRSAATKTTPAKAAPAKAAEKVEEATAVAEPTQERIAFELLPHPDGHTKNYTKWVWPEDSGGTGTLYARPDATQVRVAVYL